MIVTIITYTSIYLGIVATTFYILAYLSKKNQKKPLFTNKELPFLTIIIPAYNEEKSIKRTIQTALDSDYPKDRFEIIVVDDYSTDLTEQVVNRFTNSKKIKFYKRRLEENRVRNHEVAGIRVYPENCTFVFISAKNSRFALHIGQT